MTEQIIRAKAIPAEVQPRGVRNSSAASRADRKACETELRKVARELRDAQNAMVQEWLGYHYVAGTAVTIASRGSGATAIPASLLLSMYHAGTSVCQLANTDTVSASLNWLAATIKQQNSPRSNMRRWKCVLIPNHAERAWHWSHPQPIRTKGKSVKLERVGGELHAIVRCTKKTGPIRLKLKGEIGSKSKRASKYNERLAELLACDLKGVLIQEKRGKWFLTFLDKKEAPDLPVSDDLPTMLVRTSNEAGWRVRFNGNSAFVFGGEKLADLANARREQIARRAELKAKGLSSLTKQARDQKNHWENYTRTVCQQVAAEMAGAASRHGIKRLAVMAGDEWCALGAIGNDDLDKHEPTRFPFAAFAEQLRRKCQEHGIIVVSRPNLRSVKRRKEVWRKKLEARGCAR